MANKVDAGQIQAIAWAQSKIKALEPLADAGDAAAKSEVKLLKRQLARAERDQHFDAQGLVGKLKDSFAIVVHHPVAALVGAGAGAATFFATRSIASADLLAAGAAAAAAGGAVDWGASNFSEMKQDSAATTALEELAGAPADAD